MMMFLTQASVVASLTVFLHGQFVLSRASKRYEGESPGGSVVKSHTDTPQVYAHTVRFLMMFAQHSAFIHVWMLYTHKKNTQMPF